MSDSPARVVYPAWLEALDESKKSAARLRFLLRLAALYATPGGSLTDFCAIFGKGNHLFQKQLRDHGHVPLDPKLAVEIEKIVGRHVVRREDLAPEIFQA